MTAVDITKPPEVTGPADDSPFVYSCSKGTVTVPALSQVPMGAIRKLSKLGDNVEDVGAVFDLIEAIAGPESMAVIDLMLPAEFTAFLSAWQSSGGLTLGE